MSSQLSADSRWQECFGSFSGALPRRATARQNGLSAFHPNGQRRRDFPALPTFNAVNFPYQWVKIAGNCCRPAHFAIWTGHFSLWLKYLSLWRNSFAIWRKAFALWIDGSAIWMDDLSTWNHRLDMWRGHSLDCESVPTYGGRVSPSGKTIPRYGGMNCPYGKTAGPHGKTALPAPARPRNCGVTRPGRLITWLMQAS